MSRIAIDKGIIVIVRILGIIEARVIIAGRVMRAIIIGMGIIRGI